MGGYQNESDTIAAIHTYMYKVYVALQSLVIHQWTSSECFNVEHVEYNVGILNNVIICEMCVCVCMFGDKSNVFAAYYFIQTVLYIL